MSITSLPAKMPLNEMSWQGIKAVARAGKAIDYWKVGEPKTIVLNGTVAGMKYDHFSIDAFILGFDHNPDEEGYHNIHFGIGMKHGILTGLCDRRYNDYGRYYGTRGFRMNMKETNLGGWASSYMRKEVLGSSGDPYAPVKGTLLSALPRALREVMRPTPKYSDNAETVKQRVQSEVSKTMDVLWLPSGIEWLGVGASVDKQKCYDFFGRFPIQEASPVKFWTRSAQPDTDLGFSTVNCENQSAGKTWWGSISAENSVLSLALLPCFAV